MNAKPPLDPKVAALMASVFAVLGVFGVFGRLELDADQVAILLGSVGAILTTIRAALLGRAHRQATKPAEPDTPVLPAEED